MDTNDQPMTPRMVTLWYRAPEILIKDEYGPYGLPSDLWSLGITFAELEKGYAPFQHKHELGMMATIWASLGGYRVSTHSSVLLKKVRSRVVLCTKQVQLGIQIWAGFCRVGLCSVEG